MSRNSYSHGSKRYIFVPGIILFSFFFCAANRSLAQPIINSFTPLSGPVGSVVTIQGLNFSTDPLRNIVYFGAVRSAVLTASATTLTVTVPTGASYQSISVIVNGLSSSSPYPFITTFAAGNEILLPNSFNHVLKLPATFGLSWGCTADFDGDMKPDLAVSTANIGYPQLLVYKNTSQTGNISFGQRLDLLAESNPIKSSAADLDNDGKPDLVQINSTYISVYRNTSTPENISFLSRVNFAAGQGLRDIAFADFDADGKTDIAVTNYNSAFISILTNTSVQGLISFATPFNITTELNLYGIGAGDLDGDGKPDLAMTNFSTNAIYLLRNTSSSGNFSFISQGNYNLPLEPRSICIADLNGDNKPELTVANSEANNISVLENASSVGTIEFSTPANINTGGRPVHVTAGDINGDAKADLAVVDYYDFTISLYRNTSIGGSLSFANRVSYPTSNYPQNGIVEDFDGDGKSDLAVAASSGYDTVNIFLNTVPPPFTLSTPAITGVIPTSAGPGDTVIITGSNFTGSTAVSFGGTNAESFLVVSPTTILAKLGLGGPGNVEVISSSGTGSFSGFLFTTPTQPSIASFSPTSASYNTGVYIKGSNFHGITSVSIGGMAAKDFKVISTDSIVVRVGSGNSGDIVVTGQFGSATEAGFTYVENMRVTSFSPASGPAGTTVTIEGKEFGNAINAVTVYFGIAKAQILSLSNTLITVKVPSGANYQEIIVTKNGLSATSQLPFFLTFNDGNNTLSSESYSAKKDFGTTSAPNSLAAADFNGDGKSDLAMPNKNGTAVGIFVNSGGLKNIEFSHVQDMPAGNEPEGIVAGDIDGDGKQDLVVANRGSSTISVFLNTSSGNNISFAPKVDYTTGPGPWTVKMGDIDMDGKPEMVVSTFQNLRVSIFRNTSIPGTLSFDTRLDFETAVSPTALVLGDINGDGLKEIVVTNYNSSTVSILKNTSFVGKISFAPKIDFTTAAFPNSVAIGDLNNDGMPDMAIGHNFPSPVYIYPNTSTINEISFGAKQDLFMGGYSFGVTIADLNGDAKPDLTVANYSTDSVTIFKNTSNSSTITFGNKTSYGLKYPTYASFIADFDGDAKPDMAVTGYNSKFSALRNQINDPSIISISPTAAGKDINVMITGANFIGTSEVSFGGAPAASFQVINATTISAYVGEGASGDVVVRSTSGVATYSPFIFLPPPIITSFSPTTAGPGKTVTITGSNFIGTNVVYFGGTPASSFAVIDSTTIKAIVGSGTSGHLVVRTNGGSDTLSGFLFYPAPAITSFNPTVGTTGTVVTIQGVNLANADSVLFGGIPALTFEVVNDATIVAVVGGGASGNVSVITPGGKVQAGTFNYTPPPAPIVNSFNPSTGTTGTEVTISGQYFTGASQVTFGGSPALSFTVTNATTITALVGGGATGAVAVVTPGGSDSSGTFAYIVPPAPVISNFNPASAIRGTVITIAGTNFLGATEVSFGGVAADTFTVVSSTVIVATVSTGASGVVSVTTPGGTVQLAGFSFVVPTITSITPSSGPAGTSVIVSGNGFDPVASNNIVHFGGIKAQVTNATSNALTVIAPGGASYGPIVVNVNGLLAASAQPFVITFPGLGTNFMTSSFITKPSLSTPGDPYSSASADFDGDGKPDLAVAVRSGGLVSVFRNESINGIISLNSRKDFITGTNAVSIAVGDFNGDGRMDILTANSLAMTITVLKNTSVPGNISFDAAQNISISYTGLQTWDLKVADLDGDGKVDLVGANFSPNVISIFRNTSVDGTISFAPKIDLGILSSSLSLCINDFSHDGKPDLAVANANTNAIYTFANTSVIGSISFAAPAIVAAPYFISWIESADMNSDGWPDLVVANSQPSNFSSQTITIFPSRRNVGSVSWNGSQHYSLTKFPKKVFAANLDGDTKPDLVVTVDNEILLLKNITQLSQTIALSTGVYYSAGVVPTNVSAVDFDRDGRADIAVATAANSVVFFHNKVGDPIVQPSGLNPVSGEINKLTLVHDTIPTYSGQPYVQRQYEITPASNPLFATATITLFYTQQEFNNFNLYPGHGRDLPTGPTDQAGKDNLRIFQHHGFSATGNPGTYGGDIEVIDPDDAKIVWNANTELWEVTFEVNGFSGFFVGSLDASPLPLTLLSFSGKLEGNNVILQWVTANEVNVDYFELQRSRNSTNFAAITRIDAIGTGNVESTYSHTEAIFANDDFYYRLKMVDRDAKFTYSNVVRLKDNTVINALILYPNPAKTYLTVKHPKSNNSTLRIFDLKGRLIKSNTVSANSVQTRMSLQGIKKGSYILVWSDALRKLTSIVVIQ